MKERLIPVKSESELRIGMIVVSKNCACSRDGRRCGATHRQMLLGRRLSPVKSWLGWSTTKTGCLFPGYLGTWKCIPEGRLFRVDDGMDAETLGARSSNPKSLVRS